MFPIELKSIKGILEEANIENLKEFHSLMGEIINLPNEILDESDAKHALEIIDKISKIEKTLEIQGLKTVEYLRRD